MRVELTGLSKRFRKLTVLEDVSFELPGGEVVAVLGPNGAGKTTLLRCIAGLLAPSTGAVRLDGRPLDREDLALRRAMAFLPDMPPLDPEQTVLEHAGLVLRLYEVPEQDAVERVLELLRRFDLLTHAPLRIQTLSRGQAYKAGLIPLIAAAPRLLLLDEPFASGMDPNGLLALKDFARQVTARGGTVIYTTQIMDVVERFSDRVCLIHRGRAIACQPLPELLSARGSEGLEHLFRQLREEP
ncbi:MAG: ABC transporter ATP-binding protein [Planctomycetota bacterium]